MKRTFLSWLTAVLLLLSVLFPLPAGAAYILGDVNDDSLVNAADATQILIAAAKKGAGTGEYFTSEQKTAADADQNTLVNASDATYVLRYAAKSGANQFKGTFAEYMQSLLNPPPTETTSEKAVPSVEKNGTYTSPEDVAAYIHTFGTLPSNFITKEQAQALGWDASAGNLWTAAPGKSIGGDRFYNREGLLPEGTYYECDVNYSGGKRGAERLVYSTTGSIYYTSDHYSSFKQLY